MADYTLTARPAFEHAVTSVRRCLRTRPGAGSMFARQINERELSRYRLTWPIANLGDRYNLLKTWEDTYGGVLPFDYSRVENVSPSTIECVFVPDSLRITQISHQHWRMDVEVEEVHD